MDLHGKTYKEVEAEITRNLALSLRGKLPPKLSAELRPSSEPSGLEIIITSPWLPFLRQVFFRITAGYDPFGGYLVRIQHNNVSAKKLRTIVDIVEKTVDTHTRVLF